MSKAYGIIDYPGLIICKLNITTVLDARIKFSMPVHSLILTANNRK